MHDVDTARKQVEGARSSMKRNPPKHHRVKSDSTIIQSGTLTVAGHIVTKEQVLRLKQALDTLKAEENAPNEQIGREMEALSKRYKSDSLQRITLEEVLIKTFRAIKRQDLAVMKQWVAGKVSVEWEKAKEAEEPKKQPSLLSVTQYQELFQLYDTNKNGDLSLDELRSGLSHLFSNRDIEEMFRRYDSDHDQHISLQEFLHLMAPES
jgi:hypothetical protein